MLVYILSGGLHIFTEGEDSDIDMATEVLMELAQEESEKGEDQELFFFFGADVSIPEFVKRGEDREFYFWC